MKIKSELFLPTGMKKDDLPLNNRYVSSIATAWILNEDFISGDALWLANECAYFGIKKDEVLQAIVAGFACLYYEAEQEFAAKQAETDRNILKILMTYERLLLHRIGVESAMSESSSLKGARILGILRTQAERFYAQMDEKDVIASLYIKRCMQGDTWLTSMAEAQRHMFEERSEESGIEVERLYTNLFHSLMPVEMQSVPFVTRMISAVARI